MEISDPIAQLQADLDFHQAKDEGLGFDGQVCLRFDLVQKWGELIAERDRMVQDASGSMAEADTSDIDAAIELAERAVEPYILELHFRAITGPEYTDLLGDHPGVTVSNPQVADLAAFRADLSAACFIGSTYKGNELSADQFSMEKIREKVSFGEMEDIDARVHGMNRRTFDRDFLSQRSKPIATSSPS